MAVAQLPWPMSVQVGAQPFAKKVSKLRIAVAGSPPYQIGDGGFASPDARDVASA